MDIVLRKLQYKNEKTVFVFNHPTSFQKTIDTLIQNASVKTEIEISEPINFVLIFVNEKWQLENFLKQILPNTLGDAVLWICYPKQTSKTYICDFNRDSASKLVQDFGLDSVRMISIDDDWSGLRVRKQKYIKYT